MTMQFKATVLDETMTLYVEPARRTGRRFLVASFGNLTLRLPIADDVAEDRVAPVMMTKLEVRLF